MVGQADRLELRGEEEHWKYQNLDLSPLLFKEPMSLDTALFKQEEQDHGIENVLDRKLIQAGTTCLEEKQNRARRVCHNQSG
jgi:glutamate synthase (NADPH/NADH) large chain